MYFQFKTSSKQRFGLFTCGRARTVKRENIIPFMKKQKQHMIRFDFGRRVLQGCHNPEKKLFRRRDESEIAKLTFSRFR